MDTVIMNELQWQQGIMVKNLGLESACLSLFGFESQLQHLPICDLFFFFNFWPGRAPCGILVAQTG